MRRGDGATEARRAHNPEDTTRFDSGPRHHMISQPGVGRAGPVVREPDRRLADRASAPSLPAWRVALYTALVAVELLALGALLVVGEPIR